MKKNDVYTTTRAGVIENYEYNSTLNFINNNNIKIKNHENDSLLDIEEKRIMYPIGMIKKCIFVLMIILSFFFISSLSFATDYEGINTATISATSGAYTTANTVTWETQEMWGKSIVVSNDETNDATLRIRTRAYYDGDWVTLQEGTLNGNTSTQIQLNNWYFDVEIAVKDDTSGDHTAITIGFGGKI